MVFKSVVSMPRVAVGGTGSDRPVLKVPGSRGSSLDHQAVGALDLVLLVTLNVLEVGQSRRWARTAMVRMIILDSCVFTNSRLPYSGSLFSTLSI